MMQEPTSGASCSNPINASLWSSSQSHRQLLTANPISLTQNSAVAIDLNSFEEHLGGQTIIKEGIREDMPKEPLFEKPLTPSDVGKLNRLVIPKLHAEKYFPLDGISDSGGEKGVVLSFQDELGKVWRFRYSYWNSSQSYVLTKGWSRFVKEKMLDAGDVVLFERHRLESDRHFIGWRRRSAAGVENGAAPPGVVAAGGGWTRLLLSGQACPTQTQGPAVPNLPDHFHAAFQGGTTPTANPKTLRLFGVNLECQPEVAGSGSQASSEGRSNYHSLYDQCYHKVEAYDHYNHMDINFSSGGDQAEHRPE